MFFSLNASGISEANASTSTLNTSNANNTGISEIMELAQRNPQELHEITSLIAELMPPLPVRILFGVFCHFGNFLALFASSTDVSLGM